MEYAYETRSKTSAHRHFRCPHCKQNTFVGNIIPLDGLNETHARTFDGERWLDNCPGVGKLEEVTR